MKKLIAAIVLMSSLQASAFQEGLGWVLDATHRQNNAASATQVRTAVNAASITSVGTIATGVWNGTAVTVPYGGTGAATLASNSVLYGNGTGAIQALAVNSSATNKFLTQSSSGAPAWATIVSGDVPTLNQNTSGSAATLTTPRAIYGNNFDGSAALTQIIASTYGGTGNGFAKLSGPATTEKTYTLPNSSTTIVTIADSGSVTNTMLAGSIDLTTKVTGILPSANGGTGVNNSKSLTVSNSLTLAGTDSTTMTFPSTSATIARTDAANTFTGASTATSWTFTTPILGTPTSGTLTNCTSLPIAGLTASTSTALGVGSIELGHATDTTIARSGAGAITVEGVQVILSGAALGTPASGTLTNCTSLPVAGITASTSTALGVGSVELGHATDTTLSRSASGVLAVEGVVVPTISSTSTITNKRNQPRITSAASYTTNTGTSLDVSTTDIFIVTAQAGALKFNNPSGTPVQGEKFCIRIKDDGTARALTYDTQYRASSDLALPTTTVLGKTLYMLFVYNATDTKCDLLAVLNNF